jgi:hypothetical protein
MREDNSLQVFGVEKDHIEDTVVDGMIMLRYSFIKWDLWAWTGSVWLRI